MAPDDSSQDSALQYHGGKPDQGSHVLTIGYEDRDLAEILEIVHHRGVKLVLDIREAASSRKAGFNGRELNASFASLGVKYAHLPQLGCSRDERKALWRGGEREHVAEKYRQRLAERSKSVEGLVEQVRAARTLLICLERNPQRCHRSVLGEKLRMLGLQVEDL